MDHANIPSSEVLLDLWLDQCSAAEMAPIGLKGEPSYRYFWSTWVKFLRHEGKENPPPPIPWHEVESADIARFLNSGVRERKKLAGVSIITKRRYWRLLDRIYDFAQANAWVKTNPAAGLNKAEKLPSERPTGAIMLPRLWQAAMQALGEPLADASDPQSFRNRALLLVLFEFGLTPAELRRLTVQALQTSIEGSRVVHWLVVAGPEVNHPRRFQLPFNVQRALEEWVELRSTATGYATTTTLFSTRRGSAMTDENLLSLVRSHILAAASACQMSLPPRLGPQVVRNTRLVMWLNSGVSSEQVAVRAGLKNIKGLYHLRDHLLPDVRITVRNERDDEPLQRIAA